MTTNTPALDQMPLRAQTGYILKHANVLTDHEMTPGVVLGMLSAKGVLDDEYVENNQLTDDAYEIVEDVIERNRGDGDE